MQIFHWLYANVLGNLVASAITAIIAYLKLKQQHEKHHQQMKNHIDYKFTKLTERTSE